MSLNLPSLAAAALLLAALSPASSQESSLALRIDGLPVQITHARGEAARRLAEREGPRLQQMASRAGTGGAARWEPSGPWRVLSAASGARSYALQVRGSGDEAEALLSELDLSVPPAPPAPAPLWLPPGSALLRAVEGLDATGFAQWTARSAWSARSTLGWLGFAARAGGWTVDHSEGPQLALRRQGRRLQLVVLDDGRAAGSAILITQWASR